MTQLRSFSGRWGRLSKVAFSTAALSLIAAPLAFAAGTENPGSEYTPEGVPPSYTGTENPGSELTDLRHKNGQEAPLSGASGRRTRAPEAD